MSQTPDVLGRRPGLVTFAAIVLALLGGFQLTFALMEFWRATWIALSVYGTFGGWLWIWGILDTLFALVALYAAYDILQGGTFGQIIGILIASISAIRWFFYLPAAPWLGAVVIAVDIIIIYALVAHAEYFQQATAAKNS
jgi:hypothetical protein